VLANSASYNTVATSASDKIAPSLSSSSDKTASGLLLDSLDNISIALTSIKNTIENNPTNTDQVNDLISSLKPYQNRVKKAFETTKTSLGLDGVSYNAGTGELDNIGDNIYFISGSKYLSGSIKISGLKGELNLNNYAKVSLTSNIVLTKDILREDGSMDHPYILSTTEDVENKGFSML